MVVKYGLMGAVVGFLIGFIPVVFGAESSSGIHLGVFIAGPVGFIVGILVGTIFKSVQKRDPEFKHPLHMFFS